MYVKIALFTDHYALRLKIWRVVPPQVRRCCVSNVDEMTQRLVEVLDDLQQTVIDSAVSQWRQRLRACVCAQG